jgi:hypothetical protein
MKRINRDTVIAVVLLCLAGFLYYASYSIRTPEFGRLAPGQMGPGLWPRIILIGLLIMGTIYLLQSIVKPPPPAEKLGGMVGWYRHYRNPIWCFAAFAAFLSIIPFLGMLIAGALFVFGLMTLLGPKNSVAIKLHVLTTLGTVGGMWFVFACLLEVQLPKGELTGGLEEWLSVNVCGLVAAISEAIAWFDGGACHLAATTTV